MPGLDGVEATKALAQAVPSANVLVLTMFEDAQSVVMALRAGAKGYLLKGADQDEIVRAIGRSRPARRSSGRTIAQREIAYFATAGGVHAAQAFPRAHRA